MIETRHFYAISTQTTLDVETGTYRSMRPVLGEKTAPCVAACPTGQDVRGFIQRLSEGDADGALKLLLETNPLPGVTGRVCHRPCESECNRAEVDEPLAIQALERAAADYGRVELKAPPYKGKSVAVVGSGPAGLSCAFHLRKAGWAVTVFEREESFGGLLRTAIPAFRLPTEVLDADLSRLGSFGVDFRSGVNVGGSVGLDELRASFDAVFLAFGAQRSRVPEIPGLEARKLRGGLDFLKSIDGRRPAAPFGKVAVLGGGNTAIDVARTVKRLGGEPVICSPEDIEEMPALAQEVASTLAEDIPILAGVTFGSIEDGAVRLTTRGRSRKVEVDEVIVAFGEDAECGWLPEALVEDHAVAAGPGGETALEGVFAGGDCTAGERTVAHAIGHGRRAALAIEAYLSGGSSAEEPSWAEIARLEDLNLDYLEPSVAACVTESPVAERIKDLALEVVRGLDRRVAFKEAARCLGCGICTTCGNCLVFCPDLAVVRYENKRGLNILYEYCKGCGICVTECPTGVLGLQREREGA